jgi:hypothetical protein
MHAKTSNFASIVASFEFLNTIYFILVFIHLKFETNKQDVGGGWDWDSFFISVSLLTPAWRGYQKIKKSKK